MTKGNNTLYNSKTGSRQLSQKLYRAGTLSALLVGTFLSGLTGLAGNMQASAQSVIDEVIVTATKRSESLQSVGLSISAISGVDLQDRGATDFADFALSIPNISFGSTDDGILSSRTISIRGIEGINTTGFYIDDVPLEESVNPLVLDVERVEVLRGPQGTLYGARGLGGTVRVITKKPDISAFSGRTHLGFSSTDDGGLNYVVDGAVNIPLSDSAALRVIGYAKYDEGIFDKRVTSLSSAGVVGVSGAAGTITGDPGNIYLENIDDQTTTGGQIALLWEVSDAFKLEAKILTQKTKLDAFPLSDFIHTSATPLVLDAGNLTQNRLFNISEFGEDEWAQYSLTLTYDTDFGTFTSSTGQFERETFEGEDTSAFISFTLPSIFGIPAIPLRSPIFQRLDFETIAQEVRFVSDFNGKTQLTAGLFYQNTDDDEAFQPGNYAPGVAAAYNPIPVPNDLIFTSQNEVNIKEKGLYGEVSYDISDKTTAVIGGRWYDVEKSIEFAYDGFASGGPVSKPLTSDSEDGTNLKALIEHQATDDLYLYASYAEGYRLGGFNGPLPAALGCPAQYTAQGFTEKQTEGYESDSLTSYEIGAKSTLADGRVTLNAAVFSIDFEDIQQSVLLGCGFSFTTNAGDAESQGVEIELVALLGDSWKITGAIGYTDAELASGDKLQHVPEFTYSASVEKDFTFGKGRDGFVRLDYAFIDESASRTVAQTGQRMRPSYDNVNLRGGVRQDGLEVYVFVDNATNEDAVLGDSRSLAAEAAGRTRLARNRPRTVGMGIHNRF